MFPKPHPQLTPNTYAYESQPMVKPTGFREYDARWLFGKELNLMGVQALGMGIGTLLGEMGKPREVVTGHDFRGYSASIKTALIQGMMADSQAEAYAARCMILDAASRRDAGENITMLASSTKLFATEACRRLQRSAAATAILQRSGLCPQRRSASRLTALASDFGFGRASKSMAWF